MAWIEQISAELTLRSGLLPEELNNWEANTNDNIEGAGIHQSQVAAIKILFDELAQTQGGTLGGGDNLVAFKRGRLELEQKLAGVHGLLSIFRFILAQRKDPRYYRHALDVADLVAADCYRPCIERAASWKAIQKELFRAPPLTYLNTLLSPAAFTRRHAFGAFKMPLEGSSELKLPISIVSLPFHHTATVWTFCSLPHEVGHIIDQDLGLHGSLQPRLEDKLAPERKSVWIGWLREMIADSFGVLLGHAGYIHLMAKLLILPDGMVSKLDLTDKHPTPYVRIMLLAALLRTLGVPQLARLADTIVKLWCEIYDGTPVLSPFIGECEIVADVLMNSELPSLKGHTIREFVPVSEISADFASTMTLAGYLRTGLSRPPPSELRPRLIPVAAQIAVAQVATNYDEKLVAIHESAIKYMSDLRAEMPKLLAGDDEFLAGRSSGNAGVKREQYYRRLVRELSFDLTDGLEV
jgi:hypothetical protein